MAISWQLPTNIALKLAVAKDDEFLRSLFFSTRNELSGLPLPPSQLTQLLNQQYEWRQQSYQWRYPEALTWLVLRQGESVGSITLAVSQQEIHIVDFVVAEIWRNFFIGSSVLQSLQEYAASHRLTVSLFVDHQNAAATRLYSRFGFVGVAVDEIQQRMEWSARDEGCVSRY